MVMELRKYMRSYDRREDAMKFIEKLDELTFKYEIEFVHEESGFFCTVFFWATKREWMLLLMLDIMRI